MSDPATDLAFDYMQLGDIRALIEATGAQQ
jgi:hypothetical protein